MGALPTGTVTFVFTDIEGSTRLLHELGAEQYAGALSEHRRLLREAFEQHGGVEVDAQGDALFFAFDTAAGALAAARKAQDALASGPIRVRMGVHTGAPIVADDGYVGADVHRAARIAASGHGGQVLVSAATAALVAEDGLRDLGEHRLKDLSAPERIYQLGDGEFPVLKTLHQSNLPVPATPLVGRKKELAELRMLVTRERERVVTVTGPGGTGKTRLALAVARESGEAFQHGVWFVDLSPVRDPALVRAAIESALGARVDLAEHIGGRELLLVVDNLEQVVDCAPELAELVATCPRAQLLCTSREALRISAEREYPLRPLPQSPAVELFRQRVDAVAPGTDMPYDLAAAICDRVDRLPLAVELAAARVKVLEPAALLERLERRLPLLQSRARNVPQRQRTLHSTIAWSYELMSPEEQELFRRVAVFAGGFALDAAEAVCDGELDTVASLIEKSLLRRRRDRFVMLETIREFALDALEASGEAAEVRRRHAEWLLEAMSQTNLTSLVDGAMDHESAIAEQANVRTALDWALDAGELELGLRLLLAVEMFWVTHAPAEGHRRVEAFLERFGDAVPRELLADALRACASTVYILGDYELGTDFIERSLDLYRQLGNEAGVAHMLMRLGVEATRVGDNDQARALAEESLERTARARYRRNEPQVLAVLANAALNEGAPEQALELLQRSARLAGEVGFTWWQANMLSGVAGLALDLGRFAEAGAAAREGLRLARAIGDRHGTILALAGLAASHARVGRTQDAGRLWGAIEAEEERSRVGQWEDYRDEYASHVFDTADDSFERALAAGRQLRLAEAADEALGGSAPDR